MMENNALRDGYGNTLYLEERMRPIFVRNSDGLQIEKWISWKEYLQEEHDKFQLEQAKKKAKRKKNR